MHRPLVFMLAILAATHLIAQPSGTSQPGDTRVDARLRVYHFSNFFWATEPAQQQDVNAFGPELRGAWRWSQSPAELYANASFLAYNESGLKNAYGARVGLRQDGERHDFDFYADYGASRPSLVVRNTFTTANVTSLSATYTYQVIPAVQIGGEALYERQAVLGQPQRGNHYLGGGPIVRYTGFGWRITPQVAYDAGKREVNNPAQNYRERSLRAGVEWIPIDPLYLSASLRNTRRTYTTSDTVSDSFGRRERNPELELVAAYRTSPRFQWLGYYSHDTVDIPISGEHFHASTLLLGVAIKVK